MLRSSRAAATTRIRRQLCTAALPEPHALISCSRIPTTHFQDSLPKLPVPKLEETMERMLYAAEPIVTPDELAEMKKLADDFVAGDGLGFNRILTLIHNFLLYLNVK